MPSSRLPAMYSSAEASRQWPAGALAAAAAMGHEDRLPRPSLSDRCRLGEATFAAMGPKEEDAPKTAICIRGVELAVSTPSRHLVQRNPIHMAIRPQQN